jgi:hypothetical protein
LVAFLKSESSERVNRALTSREALGVFALRKRGLFVNSSLQNLLNAKAAG